jgi:hypothetical protein
MRHYLQYPSWEGKISSSATVDEVVRMTLANAWKMGDSSTVSVTL